MFGIPSLIVQAVLVLSSTVIQAIYLPQQQQQHVVPGSKSLSLPSKIPGGSPLRFCNESSATDLFSIDEIELYPKPLYIDDVFDVHLYGKALKPSTGHGSRANSSLTRLAGTFLQNITNNATWHSFGRYGNATVNETWTQDFCKVVDSIDQPDPRRKRECPPEKGFALISMSAWVMPMFIVPGDYYFKFDAVTKEGERIYCLDANIHLEYRDKKRDGY
ncbi:Phosphatidylglycerol/phosphatidylinositol transfer protein [Acarospora aff. strigata]|nr:Phosphatidylglycerol/phosphatidylinositol transfer protein [Acarospora aff. strigata]